MASPGFETQLSGGHPNSLGNTVAVVEQVLADQAKLAELYACYFSEDEVVRLRVSNAMKRICKVQPDWLVPYLDKLIDEISNLDQASAQWTLAQLWLTLSNRMSAAQKARATAILKRNLARADDWIVLNATMQTLNSWAKDDAELGAWLKPQLERLTRDSRKSVAGRAKKLLATRN